MATGMDQLLKNESKISVRSCPACAEASDHAFRFRVNGCDIWQCLTCRLARADTADFDPATYYTGEYFSGNRRDGYADYLGTAPVLSREFESSVTFIRHFCDKGKLLELGCAYGLFLKEAKPYFDVSGIELAEDAAQYARNSGLNVLSGSADERNFEKIGMVDVIVLFDVIEHLVDPQGALALCARYLRPGGIIVVTTGDFDSWLARIAGAHWRLMTPPQHLWYFTQSSMHRLATATGLSLEYADHPWKTVPLSLILFQLRRMLGLRVGPATQSRIGFPLNLFDAMRLVFRKA
jgi:2-polyprenyl-3-methyl-5-hydroxy-6-metoxy-1,4-benzoquinol methylase